MRDIALGGFLGRGWTSPPAFIKGEGVTLMNQGEENVRENLMNLLNTQLRERPFRPRYGTELQKCAFMPSNAITTGTLIATITVAIELYEPRIEELEVSISFDGEHENVMLVNLSYTMILANTRQNFVYPYYVNEGTHLNTSE